MILDSVNKSLQAKTLSAPASNLPFYLTYTDSGANPAQPILTNLGGVNETIAALLSAPELNSVTEKAFIKEILYLTVSNTTLQNQTVVFYIADAASLYQVFRCLLLPGWSVEYNKGKGWDLRDQNGTNVTEIIIEEAPQILAQKALAATTDENLYVVPAGTKSVIKSIFISNRTNASISIRLSFAINGEALADKQYIYYDLPITANDTFLVEPQDGIEMGADDIIRSRASASGISITLNGVEKLIESGDES